MSSSQPTSKIHEGVFAINKPPSLTSAQVIRDAQSAFQRSLLFTPWLVREQARKDAESHNQKHKRRSWKQRQPLQVKMGHGGTLDPLATGVLILGVGSGTKQLSRFLECTKSYETVVLFGCETDSYDVVGKVVRRKPYAQVTREMVEEVLGKFRGKIMQRPPVFSALRVQGKRLYEYAREGKEVPIDIQERPVEVEELELVEWMEGGTHGWAWPSEEAETMEKDVMNKVLSREEEARAETFATEQSAGSKRKRDSDDAPDGAEEVSQKRAKSSSPIPEAAPDIPSEPPRATERVQSDESPQEQPSQPLQALVGRCPAPAVRLRMTVTSGFYVRSLAHDLGLALGSAGLMASLVRTRQGDFALSDGNVLEYGDLEKGEKIWGGKVEGMLEAWNAEGSDMERIGGEMEKNEQNRDRVATGQGKKPKAIRRNSSSEDG